MSEATLLIFIVLYIQALMECRRAQASAAMWRKVAEDGVAACTQLSEMVINNNTVIGIEPPIIRTPSE